MEVEKPDPLDASPWVVVVAGLASLAAVGHGMQIAWPHGWFGEAVVLGYVVIGTFVPPELGATNIGWLGGLIDHPFRYSRDWIRRLPSRRRFLTRLNLLLIDSQSAPNRETISISV